MSLVRISLLNGISVAVKLGSALLLNKILAVYVGPTGYAVIGQFQNAVSILVSLAGGLLATGVTKNTAQHFDDESKQHQIWQTAIRFSLWAVFIAGFILLLIGPNLSQALLHRTDMESIFYCLALALPAMAANNLLLAIVNGKKEVRVYITANIIGSIISLLLIGVLAYFFGLFGALLAFTISPAAVLFSTAILVMKCSWFKPHYLWGKMQYGAKQELSGFAFMGLTSALVVPVSYMLIRDQLTARLGLSAAGYWQATWKISEIYLMLITTTLSIYYLPRIAEIKTAKELRVEIIKVYTFAMPVVISGAFVIYIFRDFIIEILFTSDFKPMRDLFAWQLTGDVIKVGSFVVAYIMIGRAMVMFFILTEFAFSLFFVALSWWLIDIYGVVGVPIAYLTNYIFYWAFVLFLVMGEIKKMKNITNV